MQKNINLVTTLKVIILTICCFVYMESDVKAQIKNPLPYGSSTFINYVRTYTAKVPESSSSALVVRPVTDVIQSTDYVDGLGRPLQTVVKQGSPLLNDMVNASVYDSMGRETYKYLPFISNVARTGDVINDGNFKADPFQQDSIFNKAQFSGENYYYGKTNFEKSPLERVTNSYAPGLNWVGANVGINSQYVINALTDSVRLWSILPAAGSIPFNVGMYTAGQLYKNVTIDESSHKVIEYKNKEGMVVLKKVQIDNAPAVGHTGWLNTYYVYDTLQNLRFVIPPRAVELISPTWTITQGIANELCFRYEYDTRNRMIIKKIPGAGEVWIVYDTRNRPVMTQDSALRTTGTGQWMVTEYDELSRPYRTGLLTNANDRVYHQGQANIGGSYPNTSANYEILTQTFYDDYASWITPTGLSSTLVSTYATDTSYFVTVFNTAPLYALPLTVNYQTRGMVTGTMVKVVGSASTYLYTAILYDDKGRVIQTQSTNLSTGIDIATTQYDFSGKALRTLLQHNQKTGTATQTHNVGTKLDYDHMGRLLMARKKVNSIVGTQNITVAEKIIVQNSYNELGQLKAKRLGQKAGSTTELDALNFDYNIRGWLLGINRDFLNGTLTNTYFGFELGYDKTSARNTATSYAAAQLNGNIGGLLWKSKGDAICRQYDFGYDNANRLLKANFKQNNASDNSWNNSQVDFSVKMGDGTSYLTAYDANGNIKQMQQWGLKVNTIAQIDNLIYTYQSNSNKLQNVRDNLNDTTTKLGDFRTSALHPNYAAKVAATDLTTITDYTYDGNGNLKRDYNKDIGNLTTDGIQYNFLNLPQQITVKNATAVNGKGTITYKYDALGNKLQKITVENNASVIYNGPNTTNITTTTDYVNGFVYETKIYSNAILNAPFGDTTKLQFIGHEEGRVRALYTNGASPNLLSGLAFDYFEKDHLGNTRVVLTDERQQDVYPAATLETSLVGTENKYYTIDPTKVVANSAATGITAYLNNNNILNNNPSCTGTLCTTTNSQLIYQTNANTNKTGLGITLKVMAGDTLNIFGKSYWFQNNTGGSGANSSVPVIDLLTGLLGNVNGQNLVTAHGAVTPALINTANGIAGISILSTNETNQSNTAPTIPKAFINYLFFDEQFKCVGSGFSQVKSTPVVKDHNTEDASMRNIPVPKNGFVYIYCSNESPVNVFFDNLQVVHTRGPLTEETHYYPFGLIQAGISSKAAGKFESNKKFQGQDFEHKEFTDGSGLEIYEFKYRMDDPQTGRFWQIDPLAEKYLYNTTYAFSENKVVSSIEVEGLEAWDINDGSGGKTYGPLSNDYVAKNGLSSAGSPSKANDLGPFVSGDSWGFNEPWQNRGATPTNLDEIIGQSETYKDENGKSITVTLAGAEVVPTSDKGIGQAEGLSSAIPAYGSGRNAISDFQNGRYVGGTFNALMAVGDLSGLKSLASGSANLIKLFTSSLSKAPSRTYTILEAGGGVFKFGVTDANFKRMEQSLKLAGDGATASFSGVMTKSEAHVAEKYLRSLHYNSTGQYRLPGMKVPFPIDFTTGFRIRF
ncbi:DUF6443 domain-containing protein [Ferruginibacter paludis]|uniref:DUF6443 domain-containing protein n=1 Tax=Ferruginibacter paludis TaxID=1310417 RepID=UPI0025B6070E|nr:DUF6443 domain-containing protein [Ferruginibacter paludis]MDN3657817.1 DUF6443 domain-containing protein [Ferruginibacter paludis]